MAKAGRKPRESPLSQFKPHGCGLVAHVAAVFIFLVASLTQAQESQFLFDPNGNLLAQTAETIAPPQILGQPQMQVVQPGARATFSVVARDTSGLSYQWLFSGTNLPGQTSDALLLSNVSTNNQGYYSAVLVNSSGSVTSSPAPLWIDSRGCGMPDWWQLYYFSNLTQNATADFDGDGVSNWQEFLDGSNPTNSASVRYRLTLFSDGGVVQVSPNQSSYNTGDVVTLTATAIAPGTFHAWTGDAVSHSNAVTLTMNTNKTVFARFTPIDFFWANGSGGDWSVSSNWNPTLVPLSNDNAHITLVNATITVTNPTECLSLFLGDPTSSQILSGSGTLTVHGPSFWIGGQMAGGGRTVIDTTASLTIANPTSISLSRTLENGGAILWTGPGNITGNSAGIITNRPGAPFEQQGTGSLDNFFGTYRFDNAGTFRKSGSSGTNTFAVFFNNYGTVDIETGALVCSAFTNSGTVTLAPGASVRVTQGGFSSGPFNVPATALVEWTGGVFPLSPGAQLNGAGMYRINGADLVVNTDLAVSNLDLLNDTLDGSGTVTVNNAMNWTAGSMAGSGRTVISPGATLNLSNANANLSRTLENGGTIFWTGAGNLLLSSGIITNRAGALFEQQGAGSFVNFNTPYQFDNSGIFRKTLDPGANSAAINFNNYGTVDIESGTLTWLRTFTNTGTVMLAPGTTNRFAVSSALSSGPFNVPAGALMELDSGIVTLVAGAQLNGSGLYRVNGGTLLANTDLSVSNLNLADVALDGSGTVTVNNVMNWTAGNILGSGRTVISPGATLNVANANNINLSRTLENGGTILWTGVGNFTLSSGILTNRAGALFEQRGAGSFANFFSPYRFDNSGIFRKTFDSGTNAARINFNNSRTVDIEAGTISWNLTLTNTGTVTLAPGTTSRFSVSSALSSGPFNAPAGALVELDSGTLTLVAGAQLNGSGLYRVNGGTLLANTDLSVSNLDLADVALDGSGTLTVNHAMNWTAGDMLGGGRTVISPGATLNLGNASNINLRRTLENGGSTLWTGAGNLTLSSGIITNRPGALFEAQNAAAFTPFFSPYRFDNAGIFRKSISTGTTTVNVPFTNYGTVDLRLGVLAANNGFASSANALLTCSLGGTTARTNYGQLQVAGSVMLNGGLSVILTNGFLPATNNTFTVLTAGTRNGTFANFYYPSNVVTMQLNNTPGSVIVQVTGVAIPPPLLLTPIISGSNVVLTWTAFSNITYRLEFNPNLAPSNWSGLTGDVTSLSNFASKPDLLTPSNRFYRVRVLP